MALGLPHYPGWWFGTFFIFHNIWKNHQPLSFSPTFLNPKQLPKELARVKTGSFFSRTKTGIFPSVSSKGLPSGKQPHNYGKIHHFVAGKINDFYGHFQ